MADTVATPSSAVEAMRPDWELVEALLEGTREMREAGAKYLPKWPNEEPESYAARLKTAVLFPAFSRTVDTLTGKPFSKPITLSEDMPEKVRGWMGDADREGRNLQSFAADVLQHAIGYGLTGVLVEYPVVKRQPGSVPLTQAAEAEMRLRPYLVHIKAEQLLGWRVSKVSGEAKLTMLRLLECVEENAGSWGTQEIEQVRVLTPGAWEIWREQPAGSGKVWALHDAGTTSLDIIPFVPVYGSRTGYLQAQPPLIEVAHLNVAHWQSCSDQQTILHVARVPILAIKGVGDAFKLTIGGMTALNLGDNPTADAKFVEHTGAAIAAGAKDIADLEERMRQAGAELLVIKPGQVTATQTNTENAVGMCALQRITLDLQDALNLALDYLAKFAGLPAAGTVKMFTDFGVGSLAEASADLLLKANTAGKISDETFRGEMRRRGVLSGDVAEVDEVARLEAQGPAMGAVVASGGAGVLGGAGGA